jgi:hypothetical protein
MGVLSALPFISAGNICCCLWVIVGGVVAAYLLQQNQTTPITPGDGALVGLFAGLIGAVVASVLSIPINMMMAPIGRALTDRLREMPDVPPFLQPLLEATSQQAGAAIGLRIAFWFLGLFFYLLLGAIFSTIGGVLGALVFKKNQPPAPSSTLDQPPAFGA